MNIEIEKINYVEWVKLIQKAYTVGYICAFVILSHTLTLDSATLNDVVNIPLLSVPVPRYPAVLFTFFIFIMAGFCILVSYIKLDKISTVFGEDTIKSLKNFPSIANSSLTFEALVVFGLYVIFVTVFYISPEASSFLKSTWLAFVLCLIYVIPWVYQAYNKALKRN